MLNKGEWSPLRIGIILVIFLVVIIVLNQIYSNESTTEKWMICEYTNSTYKDTMKFRYVDDELFGFYREEYAYAETEEDINELYDEYNEKTEGLIFDKYFKYEITKESDGVSASTYMEVQEDTDLFDDYFDSAGITSDLAMEQIYTIVKDTYTCHQVEK